MDERVTVEFIFQFMLVFARIGVAFSRFPAIGSPYIFMRGKLALALTTSFIMMPVLIPYLPKYSDNFAIMTGYIAIELLIGFIISFAANTYYQTAYYVGQIISMQSGLGSSAFFDPLQKTQVTLFSNLILLLTIVLIFASNTHHLYIKAIADSYTKFPPRELVEFDNLSKFVVHVINDSFILAFKMVSPFLIVGLAIMTGSGMLARLMPNFQVFFVLTPAQILVMFCTMYIVIEAVVTKLVTTIADSLIL